VQGGPGVLKETKQAEIYQLKITLKYIRPPIWRRVQVPSDIILARLHRIIQVAMGWYDSHLHQFIVGEKYYGVPSIDEFSELELKDERRARLKEVLSKPNKKIVYEYDFGVRACPPEDCGGTGGYENFLAAIRDPRHEEHDEYLYWIGGEFDPEEFELAEFDTALRHIR
jgi:hypothetical protein